MTTTSSLAIAAAALVAVVGLGLPALAEDDSGTSFNDDLVRAALAERGIKVSDLAEQFGKIRATVRLPDGSTEFQFFDPDTLQPLNRSGGNMRVLSRLDVGVKPVRPSLNSLTWEDPPGND